jgi:hypothetical protein
MKPLALLLLTTTLSSILHAQDKLRIERVGLQGYYSISGPTPVRVHIPALPVSQTIHLVVRVEALALGSARRQQQIDSFEKRVDMTSGTAMDLDVPVLMPYYGWYNLHVSELDTQGRLLGEANFASERETGKQPLVIYCRDDARCLEARAQISPVQTDAQNKAARQELQFVFLKQLPSDWLDYRAAGAVVIAGPIADLMPEQEKAMEYYLRGGGVLILLEKEAADSTFLSAYREGSVSLQPVAIGKGSFYRVPGLYSKDLSKLFDFKKPLIYGLVYQRDRQSAPWWLLEESGPSFTFPRLPWLLIWVGVYIVVIGPINFAILRRLRKLEWGWITVGLTALVFSLGLYISSSSHRPKHFTLDTGTVYWMDSHSPVAHVASGFRISSPSRTQVRLTIGDGALLANDGFSPPGRQPEAEYLGTQFTGGGVWEGWQVRIGPPLEVETRMRRWSLQDIYAQGFHKFSGTVHWTSATRLRNDTGQRFRDAIYLDLESDKAFLISSMAPGEEVDLASVRPKEIYGRTRGRPGSYRPPNIWWRDPPFSLETMMQTEIGVFYRDRFFAGIIEAPGIKASLDREGTTEHGISLAIIAMD